MMSRGEPQKEVGRSVCRSVCLCVCRGGLSGLTGLVFCSDYCLHQRGDEEGQPLRADNDRYHLDQRDELCGVEQEGGAGD